MHTQNITITFILFLSIIGCSNEQDKKMNVARDSIDQLASGNVLIDRIGDIKALKEKIYILDSRVGVVHVITQDNRYLSKIGGKSGPSSLNFPTGMHLTNNRLYIADNDRRVSFFNKNGEFINFIRVPVPLADIYIYNDHLYGLNISPAATEQMGGNNFILSYNKKGELIRSLGNHFRITKEPRKDAILSKGEFSSYKENICILSEYFSVVKCIDLDDGETNNITLKREKYLKVRDDNIDKAKNGSMGLKYSSTSFDIEDNKIITSDFNDSDNISISVFNMSGKLERILEIDKCITSSCRIMSLDAQMLDNELQIFLGVKDKTNSILKLNYTIND